MINPFLENQKIFLTEFLDYNFMLF